MKTMCPPGYHHNGFGTIHELGHMMYIYIYIKKNFFQQRDGAVNKIKFYRIINNSKQTSDTLIIIRMKALIV